MSRKSRKNVGLIGLGIIGARVAAALRGAGYHVYVWNRTPRAAPNFLASPAHVAELCDIIQIFVADAQALFEVIETMSPKLTDRHLLICNSTVGPEATIEAAKLVEEHGAKLLDAPFTGSKAAAENRELVYYIGGSRETFKVAEPVLRVSSKAIIQIGEIGHAATVKVATNMLGAVIVQTLAEALAIVKRSGVAPEVLADAIEHHGVRSGVLDMKLSKMLHRDYEPHFSLKHMFKDVQLAIHIANSLDIDIPATTATAGVMYGGLSRGWADLDFAALAKIYETEEERNAVIAPPVKALENTAPAQHEEPKPINDAEPPKESLGHKVAPPREELKSHLPAELIAGTDVFAPSVSVPADKEGKPSEVVVAAEPGGANPAGGAKVTDEPPREQAGESAPPLNRIRRWFQAGGK